LVDRNSIFVIIPCYNEAQVIRETVISVLEKKYNVVVVDDCSTDDTKKILSGLTLFFLKHRVNLGQGAALQTGINFAMKKGASAFVTFDADGQHQADDIDSLIKCMEEKKADIIFGSRFLPGSKTNISQGRNFVLNIARYINYFLSGILLSDAYNGLRVFNRTAAEKIKLTENKMAHATQIQMQVSKNKLIYAECPNSVFYNEYSKRKGLKNLDALKIFFEILLYKIFR
jgi:glycosyltransferase involved in cell wall biosynthesis